nr:glycosyltransferase family 2 protein [Synechococcus elongatus]QFZ91306.1 glycosyltransferase family 2 protein [Synechococcus elongatus PCC 11802]
MPTRERADTLRSCLESVLSQDYPNFRVLVSDNASNDNTREIVMGFKSEKIEYINTQKRVSMSENFEFALKQIDSGWVTLLGDDDALVPGALSRVATIINETNTRAIRSNGATFVWPSLIDSSFGRLSFSLKRGYTKVKSKKILLEVLRGNTSYTKLPVLYNGGFIESSLLVEAKKLSMGQLIHSVIPDVYSGILFSLIIDSYIYCHEPLAINGASRHSNGAAWASNKEDFSRNNPSFLFFQEMELPIHKDIPAAQSWRKIVSMHAIILESFLQARNFVSPTFVEPSFQDHLNVIMREVRYPSDEIHEWAKLFASKHLLSLSTAIKSASKHRNSLSVKVMKIVNQLSNGFSFSVVYGSSMTPLKKRLRSKYNCGIFIEYWLSKLLQSI